MLLFMGSIGLNWYGYLMSQFYGNTLVIAFFIMMSSYGYYQYTYNTKEGQRTSKAIGNWSAFRTNFLSSKKTSNYDGFVAKMQLI